MSLRDRCRRRARHTRRADEPRTPNTGELHLDVGYAHYRLFALPVHAFHADFSIGVNIKNTVAVHLLLDYQIGKLLYLPVSTYRTGFSLEPIVGRFRPVVGLLFREIDVSRVTFDGSISAFTMSAFFGVGGDLLRVRRWGALTLATRLELGLTGPSRMVGSVGWRY